MCEFPWQPPRPLHLSIRSACTNNRDYAEEGGSGRGGGGRRTFDLSSVACDCKTSGPASEKGRENGEIQRFYGARAPPGARSK